MAIQIERAYGHAHRGQGPRFLVDRIWPRGVKRDALSLDEWFRDVAPSDRLRRWFGHAPERWPEFERRYFAELEAKPEAVAPLLEAAKRGDVTLVFGAKDEEHNNAAALRDYLEQTRGSGEGRRARAAEKSVGASSRPTTRSAPSRRTTSERTTRPSRA